MQLEDNTDKVVNALRELIPTTMNNLGITLLATIQSNTPVDTGTLKSSETYEVTNSSDTSKLEIGVDGSFTNRKSGILVDKYAAKVEFEDHSYLRSSLESNESTIEEEIKRAVGQACKEVE